MQMHKNNSQERLIECNAATSLRQILRPDRWQTVRVQQGILRKIGGGVGAVINRLCLASCPHCYPTIPPHSIQQHPVSPLAPLHRSHPPMPSRAKCAIRRAQSHLRPAPLPLSIKPTSPESAGAHLPIRPWPAPDSSQPFRRSRTHRHTSGHIGRSPRLTNPAFASFVVNRLFPSIEIHDHLDILPPKFQPLPSETKHH